MNKPILLSEYFHGRDKQFPADLTPTVHGNAVKLLAKVNALLERAAADGVRPGIDQVTRTAVAGPWRPKTINDRTANAGKTSTHISGEGIDIQDVIGTRDLARWCLAHTAPACHKLGKSDVLAEIGLYIEDPRWTAGKNNNDPWVHFQIRAPLSGKRVYVPSTAPAQSAPLPEQQL